MSDNTATDSAKVIDLHKRQSLKGFTCVSAIGLLATMQSLAAEPMFTGKAGVQDGPHFGELEATLINSPDVVEDTLLVRNLTSQEITVSHFLTNKLVFDDITVDCNGACAASAIIIPAGLEVAVQFVPLAGGFSDSSADEYLDVHTSVSRLPGGTRVVTMVGQMVGNAVVLSQVALAA